MISPFQWLISAEGQITQKSDTTLSAKPLSFNYDWEVCRAAARLGCLLLPNRESKDLQLQGDARFDDDKTSNLLQTFIQKYKIS